MNHPLKIRFDKLCSDFAKIEAERAQKYILLEEEENKIILDALIETNMDVIKAANILEHGIKALYRKLYDRKIGPYENGI